MDTTISIDWVPEFSYYPPSQPCNVRALCSLKAPFFKPDCSSRARVDIVAVIDISGSMSSSLRLVKNTLIFIIDQLRSTDRLSLVTYGTDVTVFFGLTPMTPSNKRDKKNVINSLGTSGQTNLCEGLLSGMYEIIDRDDEKADVASVLLFTDGHANVGVDKREDILEEMKKAINPPEGYTPFQGTVNTFGFGSYNDARVLELISTEGGGVYHYIPDQDKIIETCTAFFGGLVSTLSKDITMRFTASGDSSITCIHTPRAPSWKTKNKITEIMIGDLQSEEERDILVEIEVPKVSDTCSMSVISCRLSYFNVITQSDDSAVCDLVIKRSSIDQLANKKVDMQINRLLVAKALKQAQQLADTENFDKAKVLLQEAKDKISSSVSHGEDYCQKLIKDLIRVVDTMQSKVYKSHGAHYLICKEQSHARQRHAFVGDDLYRTTPRDFYSARAK